MGFLELAKRNIGSAEELMRIEQRLAPNEPDLHNALRSLSKSLRASIDGISDVEKKTSLEESFAKLQTMSDSIRSACDAREEFEHASDSVAYCLRWYKERAVNAADYRQAAELREMLSDFEMLVQEIRRVLG